MEIIPLGDSALLVRFVSDFERDPEAALRIVQNAQRQIEAAAIPGLIECAPSYAAVAVFYDPAQIGDAEPFQSMRMRLSSVLVNFGKSKAKPAESRLLEIPVCYDPEFAPDIDEVAQCAKLSREEVVRRHSAATYRVHCLGFVPGFAFLGGLPPELATPRRSTPRKQVPAGAVAIGGIQTGVYPVTSPGGWNIIGRTPLVLFDPQREPAALLEAGMHVRFRSIERAEFDATH